MEPRLIAEDVYWVGVNDRVKKLFEAMWPIPDGVSYNSYLVAGSSSVALIDTVEEAFAEEYIRRVKRIVGDLSRIKYIIANHLEPDHHGAIHYILQHLPEARVVVSQVAEKLIGSLYRIPREKILVVREGDTIDLGGKTLRFIYTPWIHWPETMMTYLDEHKILFSCDAFGSYRALERGLFDDEVAIELYLSEAKRYFSNIVAKYTRNVLSALEKLRKLQIEIIAPSHGPVYRRYVSRIISLYERWSRPEPDKDKVVVVFASMYGRGRELIHNVANRLREAGLRVSIHDISETHSSYVLADLVDSYILLLQYPTYDASLFPNAENLLYLLMIKEMGRGRNAAVINTFLWSPTSRHAVEMLRKAGFNIIEPVVETRSIPDEKSMHSVNKLIEAIISLAK